MQLPSPNQLATAGVDCAVVQVSTVADGPARRTASRGARRCRTLNAIHWQSSLRQTYRTSTVASAVNLVRPTTVARLAHLVGGVRRINEVNARRAWLVRGWVTVFGNISVCNKPTRSTQPYIPPRSLNQVSQLRLG